MDQGDSLKKVPFILITGFLGSGKTTLILDLVRRYSGDLRLAIVQNEFAPGHTDGITLRRSEQPFELLEINNGSVFCACLLSDFIDRLEPFINQVNPDVILLEATGLADPVSLGQIIHSDKLTDKIYLAASWCIVDAANFHKIIGPVSRTRHQIRIADLIWINKTDRVSDTKAIRERIHEINPFAEIIETTYGATDQIDFLQSTCHPRESGDRMTTSLATPCHSRESGDRVPLIPHELHSSPRPPIGSCVVRSNRYFDPAAVKKFVVEKSPDLYRLKGYIRISLQETLAVQCVFDHIQVLSITGYDGPTELIALGPDLNNREFSKQFLALQKKN